MVFIYTKDIGLLKYLENTLMPIKSEYIEEIEKLEEGSCVIIDFDTCIKDLYSFLKMKSSENIKIIVLDNKPKNDVAKILLSNGVKAYGNTCMLPVHLHSCIQTVKNNQIWIYPEFVQSIMLELNSQKNYTIKPVFLDLLTDREQELVNLLLQGSSNQEISEKLQISSHTTKVHISNIYKKLGVNNRLALSRLLNS